MDTFTHFRPNLHLWWGLTFLRDRVSVLGLSLWYLMCWTAEMWPPGALPEHWTVSGWGISGGGA